MIIVIDRFVPKGFGAITVWPFILIRDNARQDAALLAHERVHFKEQPWGLVVGWWLLYALSERFRLAAEARAHRAEVAAGGSVDGAALSLMRYGNINFEKARSML